MQHDDEYDGGNDSGHNDGDDHESDDDGDALSDCNIIPLFEQTAVQLQYSAKSPTWQKSKETKQTFPAVMSEEFSSSNELLVTEAKRYFRQTLSKPGCVATIFG